MGAQIWFREWRFYNLLAEPCDNSTQFLPFLIPAVEHEGQTPPSDTRSLIYYGSIWFEENFKGYAKKFNYGL